MTAPRDGRLDGSRRHQHDTGPRCGAHAGSASNSRTRTPPRLVQRRTCPAPKFHPRRRRRARRIVAERSAGWTGRAIQPGSPRISTATPLSANAGDPHDRRSGDRRCNCAEPARYARSTSTGAKVRVRTVMSSSCPGARAAAAICSAEWVEMAAGTLETKEFTGGGLRLRRRRRIGM